MAGSRRQLSQRAQILILVGFLDPPLVENEIQVLIYHAEVYYALHNLKREVPHKILEELSTDDKLKNLLRFYPFFFIRTPFP